MTSSAIVSTVNSGSGGEYLRIVDGSEELTLPIIQAKSEHRNYILATWVRSAVAAAKHGPVSVEIVSREEALLSEKLWNTCKVIVSPDDDFAVHGYFCGHHSVAHYVYLPPQLRRKGIATALTHHYAGFSYEHGRPWPFREGVPSGGTYNPYRLGSTG